MTLPDVPHPGGLCGGLSVSRRTVIGARTVEPVSMIVAALLVGASNVATAAVKDAYERLKALVSQRLRRQTVGEGADPRAAPGLPGHLREAAAGGAGGSGRARGWGDSRAGWARRPHSSCSPITCGYLVRTTPRPLVPVTTSPPGRAAPTTRPEPPRRSRTCSRIGNGSSGLIIPIPARPAPNSHTGGGSRRPRRRSHDASVAAHRPSTGPRPRPPRPRHATGVALLASGSLAATLRMPSWWACR